MRIRGDHDGDGDDLKMVSDAQKENDVGAFLVMLLCAIIAAVSWVGGLTAISGLYLFFGLLMMIYLLRYRTRARNGDDLEND